MSRWSSGHLRCSSFECRLKFSSPPAFFSPCLECARAAFVRIREARQNRCALAAFSVAGTLERALTRKAHHVGDHIDLDQTEPLQRWERAPDPVSPSLSRRGWAFARGLCSEVAGSPCRRIARRVERRPRFGQLPGSVRPDGCGRPGVSDLSSSWKATDGGPPASARRMPSQIRCRRERGALLRRNRHDSTV